MPTTAARSRSAGATVILESGYPQSGAINFQTYALNTGGTLLLDNSVNALNNRLGGAF